MKIKILWNILILIFFINNQVYSNIKNTIIFKVGDQIITSFDLENKIKVSLLLSNREMNQENINSIKGQSVRSLINLKLKKNEINKYRLSKNNTSLINNHLKQVANILNVKQVNLKKKFESKNINYEKYIDEVLTEALWQQLIFELYSVNININENDITNELNERIKNQNTIAELRLSEIEVTFDDNEEKLKLINTIINSIKEKGFSITASNLSLSNSSLNGGDIGWISTSMLSTNILKKLENLKLGEVSDPVINSNRIIFFKIIDKRTSKNSKDLDIKKLKEYLINKNKNEILNLYSNNHLSKIKNNTLIESQ